MRPLVSAVRRSGTLLPLLLALLLPGPLQGQEDAAAQRGQVSGVVVDERTGAPVSGAMVAIPNLRRTAMTDTRGAFALADLAPGDHPLVVVQLGYDTLHSTVPVAPGATAELEILLTPDPVLLEGIRVVADRLRSRRNALATSVRAFDRSQLALSSATNALEFVSERHGVVLTPCITQAMGPCAWVRGRPEAVRVYIDDAFSVGGLDHLAMFRPDELYLVEVIAGGRQVRAYTNWYMEQAAKRGWRPVPHLY